MKAIQTYRLIFLSLILGLNYSFAQTADSTITASPDSANKVIPAIAADSAKPEPAPAPKKLTSVRPETNSLFMEARFVQQHLNLSHTEILSNVLVVYNRNGRDHSFYLDLVFPGTWKGMLDLDKYYTVKPGDSIFIPVRVIPAKEVKKTSTSYTLTAVIYGENGNQIGDASFIAQTQKVSKWEMAIDPREKIYFLNHENSAPFSLNVFNTGNADQNISLHFTEIGKGAVIQTSENKIFNGRKTEFKLVPYQDTTLKYNFTFQQKAANSGRIDTEGHKPRSSTIERKYTVFAHSLDPDVIGGKGGNRVIRKVQFVKLPNYTKVNPYSSKSLPLVMDLNSFGLLTPQPVMIGNFRGNTVLDNGARLSYFTQVNFTTYRLNSSTIQRVPFFVGYNTDKYSVSIGNVGSAPMQGGFNLGGGRGINASYNINDKHKVGVFYNRGPRLLNAITQTFGTYYNYRFSKSVASIQLARQDNYQRQAALNILGTTVAINELKNHTFNVMFAMRDASSKSLLYPVIKKYNYSAGFRYNGRYLNDKITENFFFNYIGNTSFYPSSERINARNNIGFNYFPKLPLALSSTYNRFDTKVAKGTTLFSMNSENYTNSLSTAFKLRAGNLSPGIFYSYNITNGIYGHSRGANLAYSMFNTETSLRFMANFRGGYNYLPQYSQYGNFFFLQSMSSVQYRTYSVNFRYLYGPQFANDTLIFSGGRTYPQFLTANFSYQHVFNDDRFMMMPFVNYSYNNQNKRHNFGLFPEFYYYSYSGWRFKAGIGYNFSASKNEQKTFFPTGNNEESENNTRISQNVNLSLGLRKEFGIPIPQKWSKMRFTTIEFRAFYDLNGNKKFDKDEVLLENVVIGMGDFMVQTNEKGVATIENIKADRYPAKVFSLMDLGPWFPIVEDTMTIFNQKQIEIPFVRGVRISGNVVIDRDKVKAELSSPLDVSRIKITALDSTGKEFKSITNSKGEFDLYVPYGVYFVTMDESILGDKFFLLKNNIRLELKQGMDGIFQSFYIVEKRRKLVKKKFGPNGKVTEIVDETGSSTEGGKVKEGNQTAEPSNGAVQPGQNGSGSNDGSRTNGRGSDNSDKAKSGNGAVEAEKVRVNRLRKEAFLEKTTKVETVKGLFWTIQVGAFQFPINPRAFEGLTDLYSEELPNQFIRVSTGNFKFREQAEIELKKIVNLGFHDAHVIAYNNGQKITSAEAEALSGDAQPDTIRKK